MPAWAIALITSVLPTMVSAIESVIAHLIGGVDASHPASASLSAAQASITAAKGHIANAGKAAQV